MKKVIKIGFPIVCVALIGGTFILLNKFQKQINERAEINAKTTNSVKEEKTENTTQDENATYSVSLEEEKIEKMQEEENEKEAIEIAKKKYGNSNDDVYFTNEGKEENKYLVAVRDKTTTAKVYYKVDIEKKTCEVDY